MQQLTIIGAGPAGYTAAIYACRAGISTLLIEGMQPGGQLTTTTIIENFPGFPEGIDGTELTDNIRHQAERFGMQTKLASVSEAYLNENPKRLVLDNGEVITTQSVIIATGASAKYLGLEDEKRFSGLGVSACATCDGFFYRKKTVAVVGGGDTACEEATYLATLAKKVYLIVRKPELRASQIMQNRVLENEKIEVLFETNTLGLFGDDDGLQGAHLVFRKGKEDERKFDIKVDGFFLAIGHTPNSKIFNEIEKDEAGYIKLQDEIASTNIPGVFAAGDVADPHFQQAITAAASGCKAAIEVRHWLQENS